MPYFSRSEVTQGIVAGVPFVDCLTTMLDDSIPLTVGEYDEWGNPNEAEFYHYMKEYSPVDNIEKKVGSRTHI
jgi:oligopeptidase B